MGWSFTKLFFFVFIENQRWPPLQDKLNVGPYGNMNKRLLLRNFAWT